MHRQIRLLSTLCAVALAADPHPVASYSKKAKFEDVRDDLTSAIEGKGLVIDYHSFVNKMLARTGLGVGARSVPAWACHRRGH